MELQGIDRVAMLSASRGLILGMRLFLRYPVVWRFLAVFFNPIFKFRQ